MYIAMNRFQVKKDKTEEFERMWRERDSYLHEMEGFIAFHLLRGPERKDHILYSSHTTWASYEDFVNWTKSESFRKAHANAGGSSDPLTLGHPNFEGFEVVQ
jgi:heme-degrading monooxygenase HmoA